MNLIMPDYLFASYEEVTPVLLKTLGIKALLMDIDNTFAPYEVAEPDEKVLAWMNDMKLNNIQLAFVSNNHKERVELFNRKIGIAIYPDIKKPLKKGMKKVLADLGVQPSEAAILGDQLLTDCLAGKRLGMTAFIVPPIKDKTNLFFKTKRLLERSTIRKYAKEHGYKEYMSFWKIKK